MSVIFAFSWSADVFDDAVATTAPSVAPTAAPDPLGTFGNPFGDILQLVFIVVVFVVVLFLARYAAKLVGGSRFGGRKGVNIDLVESHALGVNSGVQLLRVGTGYFLIGVTKDRITFLSEVDRDTLDILPADGERSGQSMNQSINQSIKGKGAIERLIAAKFGKPRETGAYNDGDDGDE